MVTWEESAGHPGLQGMTEHGTETFFRSLISSVLYCSQLLNNESSMQMWQMQRKTVQAGPAGNSASPGSNCYTGWFFRLKMQFKTGENIRFKTGSPQSIVTLSGFFLMQSFSFSVIGK